LKKRKAQEYSELVLDNINKKTVMIIVADHGHLIPNKVDIRDKEISNYLEKPYIFIENKSPAFLAFLVKKEWKKNLKRHFIKDFGDDFF